jgi:hypothetical protein
MARSHERLREMHAFAPRRGQLLKQGLPQRLHDWPAWTWSVQKSSAFQADELLVTTGLGGSNPVRLPDVPGTRHSYRNHGQQYPLLFCYASSCLQDTITLSPPRENHDTSVVCYT